MRLDIPYDIGEFVRIDDDRSIKAVIIAFMVRSGTYITAQVSYPHNGNILEPYIELWRLSIWDE